MISVDPPQTPKYIPSTQAVAFVAPFIQLQPQPDGTYRLAFVVNLLDANRVAIASDRKSVPPITAAQEAALLAALTAAAEQAILPYVQGGMGLSNASIPK